MMTIFSGRRTLRPVSCLRVLTVQGNCELCFIVFHLPGCQHEYGSKDTISLDLMTKKSMFDQVPSLTRDGRE